VARTLKRVARWVDGRAAEPLSDVVRRIFGRVLKELADVDNPMCTPVGDDAGEGGLLEALGSDRAPRAAQAAGPIRRGRLAMLATLQPSLIRPYRSVLPV
jgi:hypothetical protein